MCIYLDIDIYIYIYILEICVFFKGVSIHFFVH